MLSAGCKAAVERRRKARTPYNENAAMAVFVQASRVTSSSSQIVVACSLPPAAPGARATPRPIIAVCAERSPAVSKIKRKRKNGAGPRASRAS